MGQNIVEGVTKLIWFFIVFFLFFIFLCGGDMFTLHMTLQYFCNTLHKIRRNPFSNGNREILFML